MPVQQNIAPPLTHVEAERVFDIISITRGERGGARNTRRPAQQKNRRRMFTALDEPNMSTWRQASGVHVLEEGEVVTFGQAVKKLTDCPKGEAPSREQMLFTLEVLARYRP